MRPTTRAMSFQTWNIVQQQSLHSIGSEGSIVLTWNAMKAFIRHGKTRLVGVSNFNFECVQEIHCAQTDMDDEVPFSCNQTECHPWFPNQQLLEQLHKYNFLVQGIQSI